MRPEPEPETSETYGALACNILAKSEAELSRINQLSQIDQIPDGGRRPYRSMTVGRHLEFGRKWILTILRPMEHYCHVPNSVHTSLAAEI